VADNVAITAGSGTTVAADEVTDGTLGSCKVQYVKLMDGTLDGTSKGVISSGGALKVDSPPTSPTNTYVTSATLTSGSSANLDTGDLGACSLAGVEVWASVNYKALVYTISNGSASVNPVAIGGGQAYQAFVYRAPHPTYHSVTSSAGVDGFRVAVKNLDDTNSSDVYATFHTQT
jgi:hypothetical protein